MAVRRDSLRKRSQAEQDFLFSNDRKYTNKICRCSYSKKRYLYSSRVKEDYEDIGTGTRRAAPIIEAIKVAVQKTEDPFTQI